MSDKGHYVCYVPKDFTPRTMEIITQANQIIEEYEEQGYTLTVRQLHYQFVAKNLYKNTQGNYKRLGDIISDARLAGLVSWTAIVDRGRNLMGLGFNTSPAEAVDHARRAYRIDLWANQPWRPEVWVEKESLIDVLAGICQKHRVDYYATKGYNSQSMQWEAGRRFARYIQKGQRPIVFHLGDFDPSGWDMTRDNQERLSMFAGTQILVQRIALNKPQIDQYNPPANFLKENIFGEHSDSRAKKYIERFGTEESWELDALAPPVISNLIGDSLSQVKDPALWVEMIDQEVMDKRLLEEVVETMGGEVSKDDVEDFILYDDE